MKRSMVAVLIVVLLAVSACSQSATQPADPAPVSEPNKESPATQTPPADRADSEWEQVLAAAKAEGKLVMSSDPSEAYRRALVDSFQEKYPEIKVEYTGINGRDFRPKIIQERQVGQYLWDLRVSGINPETYDMKDEGYFDPILPLLAPENAKDEIWHGGLEYMFTDDEQKFFATVVYFPEYRVQINRDFLPQSEFNSMEQLLDPKFKGKISLQQPISGGGSAAVAQLYQRFGEEFFNTFLTEQDVMITDDKRQQVEWLVRGRYPIAMGMEQGTLIEFQKQGLGNNVEDLESSQDDSLRVLHLLNKAPHPNAAKVYINWLLSKEGQEVIAKALEGYSMRKDAEGHDDKVMDPFKDTHLRMYEQNAEVRETVNELVQKLLQ